MNWYLYNRMYENKQKLNLLQTMFFSKTMRKGQSRKLYDNDQQCASVPLHPLHSAVLSKLLTALAFFTLQDYLYEETCWEDGVIQASPLFQPDIPG